MRVAWRARGMGLCYGWVFADRGASARKQALLWAGVIGTVAALVCAMLLENTQSTARFSRASAARPYANALPASLAAAASSRIGASDHRFWPVNAGAALVTRGGGLTTTFTAAGARVSAPAGSITLSPASFARNGRTAQIAPVVPSPRSSEVVYANGQMTASYQAGPYGLEQSFSLAARPLSGTGALVLSIRSRGALRARATGAAISFTTGGGGPALSYGALSVTDASGREVPSTLRLSGGALQIVIDDQRAAYPIRIDPFAQQGSKLTGAPEEAGSGEFGASVALAANGNTALVGAPADNSGAGAAWVFTRTGSTWEQQGTKLTGGEESGKPEFGFRVAISGDGNTALIGGPAEPRIVATEGEVTGGSTLISGLLTTAGIVAGNTVLVEVPSKPGTFELMHVRKVANASEIELTALVPGKGSRKEKLEFTEANIGAAWLFTRGEGKWTQQGPKLEGLAEEQGGGEFGDGVALSGEGNTALIGGGFDKGGAGAAWVYTRSEGKWEQQGAKLTGGEENGEAHFGFDVALSEDGNTALAGGGGEPRVVATEGQVTGGSATIKGLLTTAGIVAGNTVIVEVPPTREITEFKHVAKVLNASEVELTTAVSGKESLTESLKFDEANVGAAWVFTRSAEKWQQQGPKLTGTGESGAGRVGFSVALSGDGNTALLGGPGDNAEVGAAWVFARAEEKWMQQGSKLTGTSETGKGVFGTSAGLSADGNVAVIGGASDNGSVGAAWVFGRSGTTWEQTSSKLTGGGEIGKGRFGRAAAVSSDASTAIFGGSADNEVGAIWPFTNVQLAPAVATGSASAITQTSATLNATVDPEGETVTDCHFNYGTTTSYGSSVPCSTLPGSGASPVPVSAPLTSLGGGTTYHFQIVATNATGTSEGADRMFTTSNPPEYGRCVKLAKGVKGKFSNSGCTAPATAEKFEYEWEPGPGTRPKFTQKFKSLTTVALETVGKKTVKCSAQTGVGEYTGAKSVGNVVMTFTGCEFSAAKCASAGAAEGEVVTKTLEGVIGIEKAGTKGPTSSKISLDLFPVGASGPLMEFTCGASSISIKGSVLVPVGTNKMVAGATLKYAQTSGKQKPEKLEGMPKDTLEASIAEGPYEQMGLALTTIETNEEKIEVNTVV